ncbi:hypothetical protein [Hymenobacter sp. UYCo722]|uniref:hypothetical protein n=1 Tax=Hymenobacter sp. UYCo722 TaxID=3156335 RepID=UPI0033966831
MPTSDYGGQGAPSYNEGDFTVKYYKTSPILGRQEKQKRFALYDKAKAFYDGIDESAAIWNTTRGAELCEAKDLIAYFAAWLQHKKQLGQRKQAVTIASDSASALARLHHGTKGTEWNLLKDTWREVTPEEYQQLKKSIDAM